ncbi:ATP-binding protein [Geomonas subterranea]|uniref:ATP-binding protein n=1 Tax=Geomonas subterranea TaxID=2847989 RepID=UPI001CD79AC1|nr:ATP-binding protein [Geomonas fuzhouensis]
MRGIFWKIFMWFWLATVLSGFVFFLIAINLRLTPMRDGHRRYFDNERHRNQSQAVEIYGRTAAAITEREGSPALVDASRPTGAQGIYLFSANGTPLSKGVPQTVHSAVLAAVGTAPQRKLPPEALVVRVLGPNGTPYFAAASFPAPPPPPDFPPFPLPPHFWLQLAVTLVVSGFVCYVLSWRLTAPVRRLREATQGLAAGKLGSRVAVPTGDTGNELSDLGRDFNTMAARIEQLVKAHQQLVRDVSHELRSPLARLNVALELARKESTGSAAPALNRIEYEGERLNQLIGELLTLSRLDEEGTGMGTAVDLAELVGEVVRDAEFEACAANRHVRASAVQGLQVSGNRELLRRALENVVRNAVCYTREGSCVEVILEGHGEREAVIRVRDSGPGVPDAELADIFRAFYRVGEARDRQSGGTGIGLAIAEKTVALYGGSISARNLTAGGLEVEIRLPV